MPLQRRRRQRQRLLSRRDAGATRVRSAQARLPACGGQGGWHTLPHHPNESVEFTGACLPQAGRIPSVFEGCGFRRGVSHLRRSEIFLRCFPALPRWANLFRAYGAGSGGGPKLKPDLHSWQTVWAGGKPFHTNPTYAVEFPGGGWSTCRKNSSFPLVG